MEITLFGKQFFINKIVLFLVIIFLTIGSGVLGYFLKQVYQPLSSPEIADNSTEITQSKETAAAGESAKTEEAVQEEQPEIKVYVIGCVKNPGVVTIKKGQIINDVIKEAGGATKEADLENINLAYKLDENTMLRIKSKGENKSISSETDSTKGIPGKSAANSKTVKTHQSNAFSNTAGNQTVNLNKMNTGVDIIKDSQGAIVEESKKTESNSKGGLININTASQAELENLPNVGPATAKAIINYREKNGGFKSITDIMKITGIKQKTFDKIKDFICIE